MSGTDYDLHDYVLVSSPSDMNCSPDTADICQLIDFIDNGE